MQTVSGLNVTELKLDVTELKLDRLIDDMRFLRLQMIGCNRRLQEIETYLKPSELDEGRELDEWRPASKWRKTKTMRYLTTIMLALMFMTVGAQADLITNGNFSAGDTTICGAGGPGGTCPGWTVTEAAVQSSFLFNAGNTSYDGSSVVIPPGAGFASFGASAGVDDELSQVLATVPGQSYTVSFLLAGLNASASRPLSTLA